MASKDKKYTLFKKTGDGSVPPCAFFLSPAGCRNGDKCKFAHVHPSTANISSNNSTSSSDISSESEDESPPLPLTVKLSPKAKRTPQKNPKVAPVAMSDDMFAAPGEITQTLTPVNSGDGKKKRKRKPEHSDPFAKPKTLALSTPSVGKSDFNTPTHTPKSKKKTKVAEKTSSFRDLNLPVASFSIPGASDSAQSTPAPSVAIHTPKSKKNSKMAEKTSSFRDLNLPVASFSSPGASVSAKGTPAPSVATTPPQPKYPIPSSTPEGIKWQNAVIATRNNPRYKSNFDFDKAKQQMDEPRKGKTSHWVTTRPFGAWCANNPPAIAIDCEMCETKDPVTGASNPKALCRLSVVNAVNPDEVLIDTLVKPTWPVVDYRSKINGIKKEHLDSVQFTLKHAQAFMIALCSNETVIIGHALHNDLVSLQMGHHCNVDSAMLFSVKDEPSSTCSLRDLAMSVMTREMPEVHDSVNDALVALLAIQAGYLETGGSPAPVARSFPPRRKGASSELFVHRIPKGVFQQHISKMFLAHTQIEPKEVPTIEFNSETGKTTVVFASGDHANLVFKSLEGEAKPDKTGRLQKRVYLRNGGYICIRKMTAPKKH